MGLACVCLKNLAVGFTGFKVPLFYAVFCFIIWNLYVRIVDVQIIVKGKKPVTKKPSNFDCYDSDIDLFILEQKITLSYASSWNSSETVECFLIFLYIHVKRTVFYQYCYCSILKYIHIEKGENNPREVPRNRWVRAVGKPWILFFWHKSFKDLPVRSVF